MPTFQVELENGHAYEIESDDEAQAQQAALAEEAKIPQTGAVGTFLREAAGQIGPGLGTVGAAAAAGLGTRNPALMLGSALVGGIYGEAAQRKAFQIVAPETAKRYEELRELGREQHPVAATIGRLAGPAPIYKLAPGATLAGLRLLPKAMRGQASEVERELAKSAAIQVGGAAAISAGSPLALEQRIPTLGEVGEMVGQSLLYGRPRGWISAVLPQASAEAQKSGGQDASKEPSTTSVSQPEVRPRMGEEAPLRQQGEVAPAGPAAEAGTPGEGLLQLEPAAPGAAPPTGPIFAPRPAPPIIAPPVKAPPVKPVPPAPSIETGRGPSLESAGIEVADAMLPRTPKQMEADFDRGSLRRPDRKLRPTERRQLLEENRPKDIIDDMEGHGIKILRRENAGPESLADYNDAYDQLFPKRTRGRQKKPDAAQSLYSKNGLAPDDALKALKGVSNKYADWEPGDLHDAIRDASLARQKYYADPLSVQGLTQEEYVAMRNDYVTREMAKEYEKRSPAGRQRLDKIDPEYRRAHETIYGKEYAERAVAQQFAADDPGVYTQLDSAAKEAGLGLQPGEAVSGEDPFAGGAGEKFLTIDRGTGRIVVYHDAFMRWWNETPENLRFLALRSVVAHEKNHLATRPDQAKNYWDNLSWAEKKIESALYRGETDPTLMGFEAIRRRMQRLAGMDSDETIRTVGVERWSRKSLETLNDIIRGIRETFGTKASRIQLAILDKVQENVNAGIVALGGTAPQEPAARRREPSKQPEFYLPPIKPGEKQATAAELGLPSSSKEIRVAETAGRPWDRKTITIDDVDFGRATSQGAFRVISQSEAADVRELGRILTEAGATSRDTLRKELGVVVERRLPRESESVTHRITILQDRQTGRVHAVSTYRTGDGIVRIVDPTRLHLERPNVELTERFLRRYSPLYSVLTDLPVRNFHQAFDSVGEFNERIGNAARVEAQKTGEYEAPASTEEIPAEAPGERRPMFRQPVTDAEAGALLDQLYDEVHNLTDVEDIQRAFIGLSAEPKKFASVIVAYQKLYVQIRRANRMLGPEAALAELKRQVYEDAVQSQNREEFVARTIAKGPQEISRPPGKGVAARPVETGAREIEVRERAPIPAGKPLGRLRVVPSEPTTGYHQTGQPLKYYRVHQMARIGHTYEKALGPPMLRARNIEPAARNMNRARKAGVKAFYTYARLRDSLEARLATGGTRKQISALSDAADNSANNFARTKENVIVAASSARPGDKGNLQIRQGANALVQAAAWSFDPATGQYKWDNRAYGKLVNYAKLAKAGEQKALATLAKGGMVNTYVGQRWAEAARQLQAEVAFAQQHWNDPVLRRTAQEMVRQLDEQFARETAAGRPLNYDQGYLPGRYEGEFFAGNQVRFGGMHYVLGRAYGKPKTFSDYYRAIEAGPYIAITRDGASLVAHRIRQGMHRLNEAAAFDSLRSINDPVSNKPVAIQPRWHKDPATGESLPTSPDNLHEIVRMGPKGAALAVSKDYVSLVEALHSDSWIQKTPVLSQSLHLLQSIKHGLLMFDIFHLARLTYYGTAMMGRKLGYRGGLSVLDWDPGDYKAALSAGLLKPEQVKWASETVAWRDPMAPTGFRNMTRRQLALEFEKRGLNVGRIQDALYKDIVSDWWIVGPYNRWLFDKYTRGLMMESAIHHYERLVGKMGKVKSEELVRQISGEINTMFGSVGRQGWFKSRTAQDLSRMAFLAPQWVEGLIKKEFGAATSPYRALTGKTAILGRAIGSGVLAMVALTQGVNLITRGKPTWENDEEGHKFDAWIPPFDGKGPGFFISPLSVFAEITHDIIRMTESKPKAWDVLRQIGENKLGPWGRLALVAVTAQTPYGQKITSTPGVLKEMGRTMVPMPIGLSRVAQAGAAKALPAMVPPPPIGSVQRQAFSTAGIKIEPAPTAVQQIGRKAQEWLRQENLQLLGHQNVPTDEPSYAKLRAAARNEDLATFRDVMQELLKTRTPQQILDAARASARRPFTGSQDHEMLFLHSLEDADLELWALANDQRMEELEAFIEMFVKEF